jgi:site-specific DNA-methyltransferase (adenine-specific)
MSVTYIIGDSATQLSRLPEGGVYCCVTSPPYWGLRSYLDAGDPNKAAELGAEPTPEAYVANMVAVFREVRRVLRDDGVLWLNLGDCYAGKNLVGIPWRVAFALQADGWYLRAAIPWIKRNVLPSSVRDRPTRARGSRHNQTSSRAAGRTRLWT